MSASAAVDRGGDVSAGGPPRFFALATLDDGTVLAGTCGRGISRSVDGGATWTPPEVPPASSEVFHFCVVQDAQLLAATGSGIWRSDDGGQTWVSIGAQGTAFRAVVPHADELVAGTADRGLMASADGGRRWMTVADEIGPRGVYRLLVVDGDVLLAATEDGLWRVTRVGARRHAVRCGLDGLAIYALARLDDGVLLAGARGEGVARSLDGGSTWRFDSSGLPDPVVTCLLADARDVQAGTGLGVARSTDAGRSWQPLGVGLDNYRIFSLTAHPEAGLIAGSYESVWVLTSEAESWRAVDTGLVRDAQSISLEPGGGLFAGTADGLLRSEDGGATWGFAGEGLGSTRVHRVVRLASGALLAGTDDGVFLVAGEPFAWHDAGLPGRRVRCVVEAEAGVVLAGTVGSGLHRSDDGGATWRPVETGFHVPYVFDILQTERGAIFLATGDPTGAVKTGAVIRSDDHGRTWSCASDAPLTSYRVIENSLGTLFVGAQRSKILRSRDGGATWDLLDTTRLFDAKIWALAVDRDDRLFLGSAKGMVVSTDDAESWRMLEEGLDGVTVYDLRAHPSGALVAATSVGILRSVDGGGSWT